MEKKNLLHCYNRGCGQTFDPETNTEESCRHHPGMPVFHDAYKGWSCCKKKSVDFTEFLSFPGCTLSKHSNVKPPEPEKRKNADDNDTVIEVRAPIRPTLPRPPVDTPLIALEPIVAPALKNAVDALSEKASIAAVKKLLPDGEIPVGTPCKNKGCTSTYTDTAGDYECQHHPGVPIFHEGMKYWTCCQKKTTDFSAFMAQKGCVLGNHNWLKENDDNKVVKCRFDWHQTAANVIVSIYAKMYHYEKSRVEMNPIRLHVNLVFPEQENASFDLDLELRGVINVSKVSVNMLASKVEITMPKAEPGNWSKLDFPQAKLPPAKKSHANSPGMPRQESAESVDDFNLDDIETIDVGVRLTELATTKVNDVD